MGDPVPVQVNVKYGIAPPIFDNVNKKDAALHWMLFEDYLEETATPEAQQVRKFRVTLAEYPRKWYSDCDEKNLFTDLPTLKQLFKAKFQTVTSKAEALRLFTCLAIKPNESLPDYKTRVTIAASKAGITDEEFITAQFITGLPSSIRSVVRAHRDTSLNEATLTAQAACVDGTPLHSTGSVLAISANEGADLDSYRAYNHSDRSRQRYRSSSNQRSKSPARSQSRDGYRPREQSQDRKFRRPRDQTPRRASPSRQKVAFRPRSRSPSPLICKFCNLQGHALKDCRKCIRAIEEGLVVCPKDF